MFISYVFLFISCVQELAGLNADELPCITPTEGVEFTCFGSSIAVLPEGILGEIGAKEAMANL